MTGRKVRTKKLGVKTPLPILRESELDQTEYQALITENQIATGVEQAEENEFHLQSILKNAGTSNDQEIPVPPPQLSDISYAELYGSNWEEPKSYIRSSATVEECINGAAYDMTREDAEFLKNFNAPLEASNRLSEDGFEAIMDVFESTASEQTPYASVDNTIVAYEHMVPTLAIHNSPSIMTHAQAIYDYWCSRRKELGNKPIHPTLKFEMHQETDESDPYVCFRRREARQTRKTRARDVQMTEKLKRLRRELEDGRQLIIDTYERETVKRACLTMDRDVFEQRARLKEMKVRLGIRTEDEDLYNHKPPKRKAPEPPPAPSRLQLRLPARSDSRAAESDLVLLSDKQAEKENMLRQEVERMELSHKMGNQNHIDLSLVPLSPVHGYGFDCKFRAAMAPDYLITPPTSTSDAMDLDDEDDDGVHHTSHMRPHPAVLGNHSPVHTPRYRRRIGRGGRLWVDRRNLEGRRWAEGSRAAERWRFDCDDDEDEPHVYEMDPYSDAAMSWRAMVIGVPRPGSQVARRPPPANAASVAEASANYQRAVAAANDEVLLRQAQARQHQAAAAAAQGGHTRAALVPAPMQAQNGAKQLSKMAPPPVLPPAQRV